MKLSRVVFFAAAFLALWVTSRMFSRDFQRQTAEGDEDEEEDSDPEEEYSAEGEEDDDEENDQPKNESESADGDDADGDGFRNDAEAEQSMKQRRHAFSEGVIRSPHSRRRTRRKTFWDLRRWTSRLRFLIPPSCSVDHDDDDEDGGECDDADGGVDPFEERGDD